MRVIRSDHSASPRESGMVLLYFLFLVAILALFASTLTGVAIPAAGHVLDSRAIAERRAAVGSVENAILSLTTPFETTDAKDVAPKDVLRVISRADAKRLTGEGGAAALALSIPGAGADPATGAAGVTATNIRRTDFNDDARGFETFRIKFSARIGQDAWEHETVMRFAYAEDIAKAPGADAENPGQPGAEASSRTGTKKESGSGRAPDRNVTAPEPTNFR